MPLFNDKNSLDRLSILRKRGEEDLMQALAPQYGLPYIDLHGTTVNPEALARIPENTSIQFDIVAFAQNRTTLMVATASPLQTGTNSVINSLRKSGFTVIVHLASKASINYAQKRYADQKLTTAHKKGVLDINLEDILKLAHTITTTKDISSALDDVSVINSPRRISLTLELIFAGALALKASDIHIEPAEFAIRLRYRLDGVLIDITNIDTHLYGRLMSRLKLLSGMTLNEKKEAQDGRFQFNFGDREIEVRASIIPGASGESIVMRLLDPSVAGFDLDKLELNTYLKAALETELKRPNGLIITTGPTGSGKTTALYAFMRAVHTPDKKIITIENPVEYKLPGIVQTQTGPDYTFASGLRAILRQDPDIIMIGEIRDREVAETAIHAAQTGHLVFSTLHTNSAAASFARLMDLGVDPRIMGSALNVILGQRLVRTLCEQCKTAYTASTEQVELIKSTLKTYPDPVDIQEPLTLYKEVGCDACGGTGYKGRVGVFEAILIDESVEEIVLRDPREHMILDASRSQKIPTMAQDGMMKVLSGHTTVDELERVVDISHRKKFADTDVPAADDDTFLAHIV